MNDFKLWENACAALPGCRYMAPNEGSSLEIKDEYRVGCEYSNVKE